MRRLALALEFGHGVRRDPAAALRWWRRAAAAGDTKSDGPARTHRSAGRTPRRRMPGLNRRGPITLSPCRRDPDVRRVASMLNIGYPRRHQVRERRTWKWKGRRQSGNVEDLRGSSGGGRSRMPMAADRFGPVGAGSADHRHPADPCSRDQPDERCSTAAWARAAGHPEDSSRKPGPQSAEEKELSDFVKVVLAETEDTWGGVFQASGKDYPEPTLVLSPDRFKSACGLRQFASGPFYCPNDARSHRPRLL